MDTTGAQVYRSGVIMGADTAFTAGSSIDFLSTIGGPFALTTDSAGQTTFDGAVSVGALSVTASGINVNGGSMATAGAQSYTGDVALGAATTFKTDGADVTFDGAITGGQDLVVDAQSLTPPFVLNDESATAGSILINGAVTAGDVTLLGKSVAWNDVLEGNYLKIFGRDIVMGGDVVSNSADGVLMVADFSFKNLAAGTITNLGGGRFLIYSLDPNNNVLGGLTGSVQWDTNYYNGPLPGFTGDGFLYGVSAPLPPAPIDFNFGAINDNPTPFDGGGIPGGDFDAFFGEESGDVTEAESVTSGDLFAWDIGEVRDAVAEPASDDTADAKKKRKAKKKKR